MYPIKEVREVKTVFGLKIKNICVSKEGKEIVFNADGYYYLTKDNRVSIKRYAN